MLSEVALFPLPNAVFFPSTSLPLHIFEPRYREMTREALETGMPIVIVKMMEPRQYNDQGHQLFHEIGGIGYILHHQELPDGRFNIILGGVQRVRVLEELQTDKPYRVGRAQIIEDRVEDAKTLKDLMSTLRGCVIGLQHHYVRLAEAIAKILNQVEEPSSIADTIASIIITDPAQRQSLLAEACVERRLEKIVQRLTDLLINAPEPDDETWKN